MSDLDLVCLVPDRDFEAAVPALLGKPDRLGIRPVSHEVVRHPRRDPGCFHEAANLLLGYHARARHGLVMLDLDWDGAPAAQAGDLEGLLEDHLRNGGLGSWARAVVIAPELEAWVFGESSHVEEVLGWTGRTSLRQALASEGLWPADLTKPPDPKAALLWALRRARKPRSSALYRTLAELVSLRRCGDPAFLRFRELLQSWFPRPG